jgi:hypothetical protein
LSSALAIAPAPHVNTARSNIFKVARTAANRDALRTSFIILGFAPSPCDPHDRRERNGRARLFSQTLKADWRRVIAKMSNKRATREHDGAYAGP